MPKYNYTDDNKNIENIDKTSEEENNNLNWKNRLRGKSKSAILDEYHKEEQEIFLINQFVLERVKEIYRKNGLDRFLKPNSFIYNNDISLLRYFLNEILIHSLIIDENCLSSGLWSYTIKCLDLNIEVTKKNKYGIVASEAWKDFIRQIKKLIN